MKSKKRKDFDELLKEQGYVIDEESDILIHEEINPEKKPKKTKEE